MRLNIEAFDRWMGTISTIDGLIRTTIPAHGAAPGFMAWAIMAAAMQHPEWAQAWLRALSVFEDGSYPPPIEEIVAALPITLASDRGPD